MIRTNFGFNPIVLVVIIFTALAVIAGMIMLQIFLSKKENKWLGLILPVFSFLVSWLIPLNVIGTGSTWQNIGLFVSLLLLANILTIVMLVIDIAIRKNRGKKSQLKKMSIQDLG